MPALYVVCFAVPCLSKNLNPILALGYGSKFSAVSLSGLILGRECRIREVSA